MESVLQRLGFLVDTSGLMRGQAAMDSAAAAGVRLGAAADLASLRLSTMGKGPATANLNNVASGMERASAAGRTFNQNAEQVNSRLTMLGTAAGTVAGIIAFQLVASIVSVASELASIPLESARASDALTRFSSQLSFAFRGSADSVRQANADIVALARDAGVSLSQIRNDYADIAISGRAAGLTRSGVSGVVGAFAQLGQLSGADPGALSRSMYQYQQMLNMGTVRWSDFRLADLNLPAFGDAVAAGLSVQEGRDVSSAELIGMISRGELSAMRLTEALSQGVPKLLEEAGGQLPQLMSRSQAAMESEWTLLLEDMGEAWRTSEFIQSLQYGIADIIASARGLPDLFNGPPSEAEQRAAYGNWAAGLIRDDIDQQNQARQARHRNAFGIVTNLDPILAAQAQGRADIDIVQQALADTAGLTNEQVSDLRRGLSLLEAQISRIESAVDRARRQGRESAADLDRYGAGAGYDLARSARGLVEQSISQMRPISLADAMTIMRQEWITGAQNDLGQAANDNRRRWGAVEAAGLSTDARRRAQLDIGEEEFLGRFGSLNDMPAAQREAVETLASRNRAQTSERLEQDDRISHAERARAQREQISSIRQQLEMGIQLGQQGRIALAQAEAERLLRASVGDLLANELLPAERARVAELVKASEELALQQRQMGLLSDAAQTAGHAFSEALREGIGRGARDGVLKANYFLDALEERALRIMDRLLEAAFAPLDRFATNWVDSLLNNFMPSLFGGGGSGGGGELAFVPGFASGVKNFSGGWAMVGEEGPELVRLPQGADVYPHGQSKAMVGGGDVTIQIIDQRRGGAAVETSESRGPNGERMVRMLIRDGVNEALGSGAADPVMQNRFGAPRAIASR